jgi:hypothetical protein
MAVATARSERKSRPDDTTDERNGNMEDAIDGALRALF